MEVRSIPLISYLGCFFVLYIFLFAIVIHLCKKSTAKKKTLMILKIATRKSNLINMMCYPILRQQFRYMYIGPCIMNTINERVEIHNIGSLKPSSKMYEGPEISNSNKFPKHGITSYDSNALMKGQKTEYLRLCENIPLFQK